MAGMQSLPRMCSFAIAFFQMIWLLVLLIPGSTAHAYLPRIRPKQRSTSWMARGIIPAQRRKQRTTTDGGYGFDRQLRDLRGGADTSYAQETSAEDEVATTTQSPVANVDVVESSTGTSDPSSKEVWDGGIYDDEMKYVTIGVLDLSTTQSDNIILLSYNCIDDPSRQVNERWGIREETYVEPKVSSGYDATELALAETTGSLSDGIIVNLPMQMLGSKTDLLLGSSGIDSNRLDNALLCIAEGIRRRLTGTQQIEVPLYISFEGPGSNDQINDTAKEHAKQYIERYVRRALYHLGKLHSGKIPGIDSTTDEDFLIDMQCKLDIKISPHPKLEAAMDMANNMVEQISDDIPIDVQEGKSIIVPRQFFGALCNHVHTEIYDSWMSRIGSEKNVSVEWEKLSIDSQDTTSFEDDEGDRIMTMSDEADILQMSPEELISTDIRLKVESLITMAFAVAEDGLLELETKMDDVFLQSDGERNLSTPPVPEFGNGADTIVNAMSASFTDLLDENKDMTESEREWVEGKRIQALKQVVGVGIHRLFHLHLQSLRDHFGEWYECKLDGSLADDFDSEDSSPKNKHEMNIQRQEAARRAEEGFRKAAFGSIPQICQHPEGELCDEFAGMYGCVESLRGLLEDMYEVVSTRGLEEEELEAIMGVSPDDADMDIDTHNLSSESRVGLRQLIKKMKTKVQKRGPAKWYERLALKVLVIGVNSIQGWIVLQALRREARRRDLEMPKFPLF